MSFGQVIWHAGLTDTMKVQVCVLPDGSAAVQVTVVVPIGNAVPDAGMQVTVTLQLSVDVGVI
jgi:hypothetical protein